MGINNNGQIVGIYEDKSGRNRRGYLINASDGTRVIPERTTFITWSLLGGLGIISWWRRRGR
jgi:hypothetical protein